MSRNKYPEETVQLILDTAQQLFLEQGYEHTTIQDIIDHLGGLTKGAIYHHFKSKEEILTAVTNRLFQNNSLSEKWIAIQKNSQLSGSEKIKKMLLEAIQDEQEQQFRSMGIHLQNMPQMLSDLLLRSVNQIAPEAFLPVIEEGIQDGSLTANPLYAKELAEILTLLANIWINPLVFPVSEQEMQKKFETICSITGFMGMDIRDLYPQVEEINKRIKG